MNRCNSPKNFLSAPGFACETVAKESKNMTTGLRFVTLHVVFVELGRLQWVTSIAANIFYSFFKLETHDHCGIKFLNPYVHSLSKVLFELNEI